MATLFEINPPAWTPFVRAPLNVNPGNRREVQECARRNGIPYAEAKKMLTKLAADEVWVNSRYQVNIDRDPPHGFGDVSITHLSVKRLDKLPLHDWRDLQRIKNELCGPEREAFELYPAESRVVDTANQYHLWVMPEGATVPVGWTERYVEKAHAPGGYGRVGQRAIEDEGED